MPAPGLGRRFTTWAALASLTPALLSGCHAIPVTGNIRADADVGATFNGSMDIRMPPIPDPGPVVPVIVRASAAGPEAPRVALIDVDGLILNQNFVGISSLGENPVSAFREKLEAAARDPRVRSVVLRINSPGGGVTATDIVAEELDRFRLSTGKPVVAALMDLATGGAYYLAVGADVVVAQPTGIVGAVGALVNYVNLELAMAQVNVQVEAIKSGDLVNMGSVSEPLSEDARTLFQEMADGYARRFQDRVSRHRPAQTAADRSAIADGRIVPAPKALALHLVDRLGHLDDAIAEAEHLGGCGPAEVVLFQRAGVPIHSIYAIAPNSPIQGDIIPLSYPGLERSKLPTFLYMWLPDPTLTRQGGR